MAARTLRLASVLALAVGAAALAASPAGAKGGSGGHHGHKPKGGSKPVVQVLATGLHNPRHLVVGSGHEILVAEAGQGGGLSSPRRLHRPGGHAELHRPDGLDRRIGRHGGVKRIVTGLPSMGDAQTTVDDDNDPTTPPVTVPAAAARSGRPRFPAQGRPHDRRHCRWARPGRPGRHRGRERHHRVRHAAAVRHAPPEVPARQGPGRPLRLRDGERSGRLGQGRHARR